MFRPGLFLLGLFLLSGSQTINKCCPTDQTLVRSEASGEYICGGGGAAAETKGEHEWLPMIYSQQAGSYVYTPDSWVIRHGRPKCPRPKVIQKNPVSVNYLFFDNGHLMLLDRNKFYSGDDVCVDDGFVMVCLGEEDLEGKTVYVKKCCGQEAVYSDTNSTCRHIKGTDYRIDLGQNVTLLNEFPACNATHSHLAIIGKYHEMVLLEDGGLNVTKTAATLPPESFCLEHVLENAGKSPSVFACQPSPPNATSGTDKLPSAGIPAGDLRLLLYPIGLLLSALCLGATLAAGWALPAAHHHALHWRCQTNHVACLLVGDVLLAIAQLAGDGIAGATCTVIGVSMHFLFLAAFFWLNTMCFNIWWTFRDLRPASLEKRQEQCRLRLYELYAWGCPVVIATVATVLDSLPVTEGETFLRPRFGQDTCWFYGDVEIFAFFYGPIGVLLLINLILFGLTARELTCGLWKRELVKSTTERAALGRVCMKLVVVMGVTWTADILSWAVGGPQQLWYVTDLINALQGVFIFIVIACQPQVWAAIKRILCKRQSLTADITGNGNHHSSSSHAPPSYGDSVTNSFSHGTRSMQLESLNSQAAAQ